MTDTEPVLFQLSLICPEKKRQILEEPFEMNALAICDSLIEEGTNKNLWQIDILFDKEPSLDFIRQALATASLQAGITVPSWKMEKLAHKDWLLENKQAFPPLDFGRYYIYGSHIENPCIPQGKIALKIDAATAFGSGKHATTQGCLKAFDNLEDFSCIHKVLDMGCGSCILSMAVAKVLGEKVQIDAVDIDPESVRVSKENIKINGTEKQINVFQSDGYEKIKGSYDLIFANILARPLIEMSTDLFSHLNQGGIAILSGFLTHQRSWVLKAHKACGLEVVANYKIKEWGTSVVKRV